MEKIDSKVYRFSDTWDLLGVSQVSIYCNFINEKGQKCNKALRHFHEGYPVPPICVEGIGDTYYVVDQGVMDTVYFIRNNFFEYEESEIKYFTFNENYPIIDTDGKIIKELI